MKLSLLFACLFAVLAVSVVEAGFQEEMDAALKKFCGGIALTGPKKSQTFTNPKKIKVVVTRKPNAQAKVINAVDAYSIDSKGKVKYLQTIWKGNYKLDKKASLTVDLTKVKGLKFPGQFEVRVWVHNKAGPDCTLMSKVFKVKSSSHSNAIEEQEYKGLNENIDRGCFGVDLVSPSLGGEVNAGEAFSVQIQRDSAAHAETLTGLELYKINMETRESVKVQDSWTGNESMTDMMNVKDIIPATAEEANSAYYYKLSANTVHEEVCDFYSHPFYVNF
ncbi:hypothetical protein EDC94DRAFT_21439 [Helicostylum pulchrum]|uniref:Uncharacterized protein n=1 Tax=Helicostylum pulchrum TaxID=562976 RepID=A0ABP9Y7C3_9FUNG|nr:hypothetical protein EDC94DRAFT_21439 [Helicostylum pulchrum]